MIKQALAHFKKQKIIVEAYRRLFRSEDGEKVLSDLMDVCGMSRSSYDTDATRMAFYEGQRSVILRITKTINMTEGELNKWFKMKEQELEDQRDLLEDL